MTIEAISRVTMATTTRAIKQGPKPIRLVSFLSFMLSDFDQYTAYGGRFLQALQKKLCGPFWKVVAEGAPILHSEAKKNGDKLKPTPQNGDKTMSEGPAEVGVHDDGHRPVVEE